MELNLNDTLTEKKERKKFFVRFNLIGFTFSKSWRYCRGVSVECPRQGRERELSCWILKKQPIPPMRFQRGHLHIYAPLYLLIPLCGQKIRIKQLSLFYWIIFSCFTTPYSSPSRCITMCFTVWGFYAHQFESIWITFNLNTSALLDSFVFNTRCDLGFIYYWSLKVLSLRHNNLNTGGLTYKRVQKKKTSEKKVRKM